MTMSATRFSLQGAIFQARREMVVAVASPESMVLELVGRIRFL